MPYPTLDSLPDSVKKMPIGAQHIFQSAFNAALKQYDGSEERANQVAYSAVKTKFKQDDKGNWVVKEGGEGSGNYGHEGRPGEIGGSGGGGQPYQMTKGEFEQIRTGPSIAYDKFSQSLGDDIKAHPGLRYDKEGIFPEGFSNETRQNYDALKKANLGKDKLASGIKSQLKSAGGDPDLFTWSVTTDSPQMHKMSVKQAIADGKNISPRVLADYPDLAKSVKSSKESGVNMDLQSKYAEIIQEQSKRILGDDASRIKKVLELCQAILNTPQGEEIDTKEALKEVDAVLALLKTKAQAKTEDGIPYPREAYAYTPVNAQDWKLRLWEGEGVSKSQLDKASAYLSPGGYKGERLEIPKDKLSEVKRTIREGYRMIGVEDMPKWVKESESRHILANYVSLEEATIGAKGIAKVVIIKPGFGNPVDNHYYPKETLARDFAAFEGAKMYSDHQTQEEEKQRPEGSIRQWVASLKNVRFEEGVGIVGDAVIVEPWLQAKLATLRDQKLLGEMGISIRAAGVGTKGKIDGKETNVVERITRVRSVDFVTEAGAGGGVLLYETEKEFDIDVVTIEALKERRPDLVKYIETETKNLTLKEVKKVAEQDEKIKELEGTVITLTTERDELKTKITEAEKAMKIAEAKVKIDEAIGKSELPEVSKAKLVEKFKLAESAEGVTDAIKAETDYVNALKEAGKPKNLGGTQPDKDKSRKDLKEAFMRTGMSEKDAEIATNVR